MRNREALESVLEGQASLDWHAQPDILVIGPENLREAVLSAELDQLSHCPDRPVPYVLLPDTLPGLDAILGALEVPYITYGESPRAHLRLREGRWVDTPLGSALIPLGQNAFECLAAVGCALLLRLDLGTALARLTPIGEALAQAA